MIIRKSRIFNRFQPLSLHIYSVIIGLEIGAIEVALPSELNALKEVIWAS
jgi:hypothetical protein